MLSAELTHFYPSNGRRKKAIAEMTKMTNDISERFSALLAPATKDTTSTEGMTPLRLILESFLDPKLPYFTSGTAKVLRRFIQVALQMIPSVSSDSDFEGALDTVIERCKREDSLAYIYIVDALLGSKFSESVISEKVRALLAYEATSVFEQKLCAWVSIMLFLSKTSVSDALA